MANRKPKTRKKLKKQVKAATDTCISEIKRAADDARKRVSTYSSGVKRGLLERARDAVGRTSMRLNSELGGKIPKWQKPPIEMPIQDMREFIAKYGHDVAILVTWTHESGAYQFTTIGSDQLYADTAVNLRNLIADGLALHPLDPKIKDLRGDHPNVALNMDQLQFLLWILGRTYVEADKFSTKHRRYIKKYHDQLLTLFGKAIVILAVKPH